MNEDNCQTANDIDRVIQFLFVLFFFLLLLVQQSIWLKRIGFTNVKQVRTAHKAIAALEII